MNYKGEIKENIYVGLLSVLILKLLQNESMYGYQIRKELSSRTNNIIQISEGSLYGPLYRMQNKNFITSEKILVGSKRFRMYYTITEEGKKYLKEAEEVFQEVMFGANNILKLQPMVN